MWNLNYSCFICRSCSKFSVRAPLPLRKVTNYRSNSTWSDHKTNFSAIDVLNYSLKHWPRPIWKNIFDSLRTLNHTPILKQNLYINENIVFTCMPCRGNALRSYTSLSHCNTNNWPRSKLHKAAIVEERMGTWSFNDSLTVEFRCVSLNVYFHKG